jgi:hypothetical protein
MVRFALSFAVVVGQSRGRVRKRFGASSGLGDGAAGSWMILRLVGKEWKEDVVKFWDFEVCGLGRIDRATPERERPAEEVASVLIALVGDTDRPVAKRVLVP